MAEGSAPTGFSVWLRLHYDGKPVGYGNEGYDGIGEIQRQLKATLQEFAEDKNLAYINVYGQAEQM